MKTSINYKSVVIIGSFNPMILTPSFLRDSCGFKSEHEPKGQTTPVASEIRLGNTHFLAELSKLQITVQDLDSFDSLFPWDLAARYLDILKYTPLNMAGVNFNYALSGFDMTSLQNILQNPWEVGAKLDLDPTGMIFILRKHNSEELGLSDLTVVHQVYDNMKNTVKLTFDSPVLTINSNFEVDKLDSDREKIHVISERYDELVALNQRFIDRVSEL